MYRRGTVLIFAIAVTTLLLTVVFGFVRVAQLQRNAGSAATSMQLARQAAMAGTAHAVEQILRDYADPDEPVTRLDGSAMATFRAIRFPWVRDKNQVDPKQSDSRLIGMNDSTTQDLIPNCGVSFGWSNQRGGYAMGSIDPLVPALSNWDGRGRWYEVEMANPAAPDSPAIPLGGDATTGVVRFSDGDGELMDHRNGNLHDAATLAPPVRCAPIMYDRNWRRLTYATPAEAVNLRQTARYRLRYAVGLRDLTGCLTINPEPSFDWRRIAGDPNPRHYDSDGPTPDRTVARMLRAWHAFPNLVNLMVHSSAQVTGRFSIGVRASHVLIGRGSAANYARWSAADPWPATYPLMYRGTYTQDAHWQFLASTPQWGWVDTAPPNTNRGPWTPIFSDASTGGATGLVAGGQVPGHEQLMYPGQSPPGIPWRNVLTGPSFSPFNACMAIAGGGQQGGGIQDGRNDGVCEETMLGLTPFGSGIVSSGSGDPIPDTPWSVNPLTAPQNVMRAVLLSTLPAGVLQVRYQLRPAGPPNDTNHRTTGSNSTEYWGMVRTRSLWVSSTSAAFNRYDPPARHAGGDPTLPAIVSPDYHVLADRPGPDPVTSPGAAEEGFIHPTLRYPGPVAWNVLETNSNSGTPSSWHDDLGRDIDVSSHPLIRDIYFQPGTFQEDDDICALAGTQNRDTRTPESATDPFLTEFPSDAGWSNRNNPAQDPNVYYVDAQGHPHEGLWDRAYRDYETCAIQVHPDGFYRDIVYAFSNAMAMARMANCRLPVGAYTPTATDLAHIGVLATRPMTLRDLDMLFLRCLGIDLGNPASAPVAGFAGAGPLGGLPTYTPVTLTPSNNLYSLAHTPGFTRSVVLRIGDPATVVPAGMLTQVMERMLNDVRLSLFGSHPSYATTFRPLDFNGDGLVACSGYAVNATYDSESMPYLCHVEQDRPASGGMGPTVTMPFCITANLRCERSRLWEIWVRGEVFDNVAKQAVSQATVETVYSVDPGQVGANALQQGTHALYRRWYYNLSRGQLAAAP